MSMAKQVAVHVGSALVVGAFIYRQCAWRPDPSPWTCAIFWSAGIGGLLLRTLGARTVGSILWRGIVLVGASANALVTLANGGVMPVQDASARVYGLWVPAHDGHRLLWLADRYAGASIGDFIIATGALIALLLFALGWTDSRTPALPPPFRCTAMDAQLHLGSETQ